MLPRTVFDRAVRRLSAMGFKILPTYRGDPVALGLAAAVFVAMQVFQVRLVPLLLVVSPLAMAWYWPRKGEETQP